MDFVRSKNKKPTCIREFNKFLFFDCEGKKTVLNDDEDKKSQALTNLLMCLQSLEQNGSPASHTDITISIGSGGENAAWQQNIIFPHSSNTKKLFINIDPYFANEQNYNETDTRKYFGLAFGKTICEIIEPLLNTIVQDWSNRVLIADFRSPQIEGDVYGFLYKHLDHYREPNATQGNLIFLHGYHSLFPVFWPTKKTIAADLSKEQKKDKNGEHAYLFNLFFYKKEPIENVAFLSSEDKIIASEKGVYFMPQVSTTIFPNNPLAETFHALPANILHRHP